MENKSGGVLLSRWRRLSSRRTRGVSSARQGLTAGFGMVSGVTGK
jgi:hypothetical protein